MPDRDKFAALGKAERYWAIASIHGALDRLVPLHDQLANRLKPGDRLVYLGNYLGVGTEPRAVIDELLQFRRWFLARPRSFTCDIAFLRGAQEEMWSKLLQLQFAPNPAEILRWVLDHGGLATLTSYGGDPDQGFLAAREGPVALGKWTTNLRQAMGLQPGHTTFQAGLKRAAYSDDRSLLFVHAGIDPSRPLGAQSDSFWWAAGSFARLDAPYQDFGLVVRGFDPDHQGLVRTPYTASLDAGCGFGGTLLAVCFASDGQATDQIVI